MKERAFSMHFYLTAEAVDCNSCQVITVLLHHGSVKIAAVLEYFYLLGLFLLIII